MQDACTVVTPLLLSDWTLLLAAMILMRLVGSPGHMVGVFVDQGWELFAEHTSPLQLDANTDIF
jgi:hypothetical protein